MQVGREQGAAADGGWGPSGGGGGNRHCYFRAPPASVVAAATAPPSSNYVPGVGRGATGFTTRAEAPALLRSSGAASSSQSRPFSSATDNSTGATAGGRGRGSGLLPGVPSSVRTAAEMFGRPPPGYVPGRGRGATGFAGGVSRDDNAAEMHADKSDLSDANFDPFTGYAESLFNDAEYDEEDREADRVYDAIDMRMDARRRSRREMRLKEEIAKMRAEKPTIHQQFADLKRSLATVTKEEWEGIPAIGDYTLKRKQKKAQWLTPAPDSLLLAGRMQQGSYSQTVGGAGAATPIGFGMQTPLLGGGLTTPLGLQTPLGLRTPLLLDAGGHSQSGRGGGVSAGGGGGSSTSLNDLGEARGTVLSVKLDKVIDNLSGQTVIDPKGYLTDLNQMQLQSAADVADIKKARTLLKSVITTNPSHAPGWIAAARLEELAGKLQAARELMASGCQHCPKSEDIWLEAARLEKPRAAKAVLAKAVTLLPHSVRLWLDAYRREKDLGDRRRVLRKALEFIPNSVRLWKEAVSLEEERDARLLLTRAVECVPQSVEIWLALARLSSYEEAQKVLNEARKQCPTSPEIWVAACKLEETQGNKKMVDIIISRGRDNLLARGVAQSRDVWLKLAEEAEASGFPLTCAAIVRATMKVGLEASSHNIQQLIKNNSSAAASGGSRQHGIANLSASSNAGTGHSLIAGGGGGGGSFEGQRKQQMISTSALKRIWKEQAEECLSRGSVGTARALYTCALEKLKEKKSLWLALAELESRYGTPQALVRVLQHAVTCCPHAEVLWLMYAKQIWLQGDVQAARKVLAEAFQHNENNESISLAAVKLERENKEYTRARKLLKRTRLHVDTPKVWLQSIQLERQLNEYDAAIRLCAEARERHPAYEKLWMVGGQLHLEHPTHPDPEAAAAVYKAGTRVCPRSVPLWLCAVECQCLQQRYTQARAVLEKARLLNPKQPELWRAAIQIELQAGNRQIALHVASKAVQECPTSGLVWAEAIFLEEKSAQPHKAVDALTRCENDVHVVLAVAKIFWREGKTAKARKWLNRSITLEPLFGDAWASLLAFELQQEQQQPEEKEKNCRSVINRAAHAMPNKVIRDALEGKLELPKEATSYPNGKQQANEGSDSVVAGATDAPAAAAAAPAASGTAHVKPKEEKGTAATLTSRSDEGSSGAAVQSSNSNREPGDSVQAIASGTVSDDNGKSSTNEERGSSSSSSSSSHSSSVLPEKQLQASSPGHPKPLREVKQERPENAETSSVPDSTQRHRRRSASNSTNCDAGTTRSSGSEKRERYSRHHEKPEYDTSRKERPQAEEKSPSIKKPRVHDDSNHGV